MRKSKIQISLIIFLIITFSLCAAPVGNGDIDFKGYIEPNLSFSVAELNPQLYNLITNVDLQPNGTGVEIGIWTLNVDNPPVTDTLYEVSYTYDSLKADGIEDIIGFALLEKTGDGITIVERLSGARTPITISSAPGLNSATRTLAARLTIEGANAAQNAAASNDYKSIITVTLSIE